MALFGLETINEAKEIDGLSLKAQLKHQVANELFKSKKTETMPCSLSFSNDELLSDLWKKIKLLINTSSKLNEYVYSNVIWNQIDLVDSHINELSGILKLSIANKSPLKQPHIAEKKSDMKDYKQCVGRSLQQFRMVFVDIFEDVRCFFNVGKSYVDRVKMQQIRTNIFLFVICLLEAGSHMEPENIVRICRFIFAELFPTQTLDIKEQIIADFLRSLYFLLAWFFTGKEPKTEEIGN